MPTLACRICGRVVYTAAAFENLFAEESRCPRCGGVLSPERRVAARRRGERRELGEGAGPPEGMERRVAERRLDQRRRDDNRAI